MGRAFRGRVMLPFIFTAFAGCTGPSLYQPMPQSSFAYPNSNVVPVGHATATIRRSYVSPFELPLFLDADQKQQAMEAALQKTGGDLIVDGGYSVKSTEIPLLFVNVFNVDTTIDGTAVRMTVGNRDLNNPPSR